MSQANQNHYYTNHQEAKSALEQFSKSMATVRAKYTRPGQADRIIENLLADKFGADLDISILFAEYAAGKYDVIVGRMRQAARARGLKVQAAVAEREALLAEMTALYCGVQA